MVAPIASDILHVLMGVSLAKLIIYITLYYYLFAIINVLLLLLNIIEGKRSWGRPWQTWRDYMKELTQLKTCEEIKRTSKNRETWISIRYLYYEDATRRCKMRCWNILYTRNQRQAMPNGKTLNIVINFFNEEYNAQTYNLYDHSIWWLPEKLHLQVQ